MRKLYVIIIIDLSLNLLGWILYCDVNFKFMFGNCYGVIGVNGVGKFIFLKLLEGKMSLMIGMILIGFNEWMIFLNQDYFVFDDCMVMDIVIQGYVKLY